MNKLAIPAILTATIMVAGMFAFMPVEQASTVHATVQANTVQVVRATEVAANFAAAVDDGLDLEITSDAPFCVESIIVQTTMEAADAFGYSSIQVDDIELTTLAGAAHADAAVIDADADGENVTIDITEALLAEAGITTESLCANAELDFIIDETGTLTNDDFDRITAYVTTTGSATVTVDIAAAD